MRLCLIHADVASSDRSSFVQVMDESSVSEKDLAAGFLFRENDGVLGQKVGSRRSPIRKLTR